MENKNRKKTWPLLLVISLVPVLFLSGCLDLSGLRVNDTDQTTEFVMMEDMDEYSRISPQDAKEWLESEDPPLLLDVRTVEENQALRIPGDFLIPIDELAERIDEIPVGKDEPIIIYCRTGNRSQAAARILVEAGFTRIYDLGGIVIWPYETRTG